MSGIQALTGYVPFHCRLLPLLVSFMKNPSGCL